MLLPLLATVAATAAAADGDDLTSDLDRRLFVSSLDFEDYDVSARTFSGFNSTYLLFGIAIASVLILGLGVALYLYDLFSDAGARSDYNYDYNNPTGYGANPEYAYAYGQQQYRRYVEKRKTIC